MYFKSVSNFLGSHFRDLEITRPCFLYISSSGGLKLFFIGTPHHECHKGLDPRTVLHL